MYTWSRLRVYTRACVRVRARECAGAVWVSLLLLAQTHGWVYDACMRAPKRPPLTITLVLLQTGEPFGFRDHDPHAGPRRGIEAGACEPLRTDLKFEEARARSA